MTRAVSLSEAKAQDTRVWEVIAQWRRAGRSQHGDDWPGDLEIPAWRDRSVGREVELG